jgi:hypothetical protein
MPLSTDERGLLRLVAQSPAPAAMSDIFVVMNPAPRGMNEKHPGHEVWLKRQLALYEVAVSLDSTNLYGSCIPPTEPARTWLR